MSWWIGLLRRHWPIAAVAAIAACLLFPNLGRDYLWEDEGDTAVLAHTILKNGVPTAWDDVNFAAPDYGQRLKFGFVMVSHPWLQYYAAAASFALFGETAWAARLPFAVAGLLTILVVYGMVIGLTRNRAAALTAAVLLTFSVQFLIFSRQARNYSLNALLTVLLIWQFHRLRSWPSAVVFAVLGVLLFHTHPIGLAAVAMLGALTLLHRPSKQMRRWFWPAAAVIGLCAAPWLVLSRAGYRANTFPAETWTAVVPRMMQFAIEWASIAPVLGIGVLYLVLRARARHELHREPGPDPDKHRKTGRARRRPQPPRRRILILPAIERPLVLACLAVALGEAATVAVTQTGNDIWIIGLHHTPALIPLTLITVALLIARFSQASRVRWTAVLLIFICTRLATPTPWIVGAASTARHRDNALVTFHVPTRITDRLLRTTLVHYVRSLVRTNPGVVAGISAFLRAHARPGDVVVTNYSWEPLYFHTRFPQAAKISPMFPIYRVAKEAGLPDYVFGTSNVRWVICRRAWPAFVPEQDCARTLAAVRDAGRSVRLAATVPETMYENRENVHFRRFPGNRYVFPWYGKLPDAQIYRVEAFEESIAHYREALRAEPDNPHVLNDLGIALVATGRLGEAIPVFRRAVRAAPRDFPMRRNLATALFDHRDGAEALTEAERAVALNGSDAAAHDLLGRALAVEGRVAEALRELQEALRLDPSFNDARDHLEQLRRHLGAGM